MSKAPTAQTPAQDGPDDKKPEVKNPVVYSYDGKTGAVVRTERGEAATLAHLVGKKLVYESPETRKFHARVMQFLNDEQIPSDGSLSIKDQPDDNTPEQIPPAPKKTIEAGDKTPEYVEWLKRYKPEEYKARYGIRGPGVVQKKFEEIDPKTGRPVTVWKPVHGIIADRKIHLTEKPDANEETPDAAENA